MSKKSKKHHKQIGEAKYNCPFCVIMGKDPPWHPLLNAARLDIDQQRSWETHMGICQSREGAFKKIKERNANAAREVERNSKRLRKEVSVADLQERINQSGELLIHRSVPDTSNHGGSGGVFDLHFSDSPMFKAMVAFVETLDPQSTRFTGVQPPNIPLSERALDNSHFDDEHHYIDINTQQAHMSSSSSSNSTVSSDNTMFLIGPDRPCLLLDGDINMASDVVFKRQQFIEETYSQFNLQDCLNPRASPGFSSESALTIQDLIALSSWFEKNNVSLDSGTELLLVLNTILANHGLQQLLHFPSKAQSIFSFISRHAVELHPVHEFKMKFPVEQWGSTLHDGITSLPEVKGGFHSFLELLAERQVTILL